MERIITLNGSPRAPKSNSLKYAEVFCRYSSVETQYFNIGKNNHGELCSFMENYSDILFVFPLYADALPVGLLNFLKYLEANPTINKPVISILINCGFLEYRQNMVAVEMMKFFCRENGYRVGSILMIGGGEAILETPFKFIVSIKIRQFAKSIISRKYKILHATMPITKKLFKMAASTYWSNYGKKFGISKIEMETMKIEGME